MDSVKFYTKYDLEKSFSMQKEEVSSFVPQCFREITIRIYVKGKHYFDFVMASFL